MLTKIGIRTGLKWIYPYTALDAAYFPSRILNPTEIIDDLYQSKLVILHGDSGSGKTSFIQAQLLPALELTGFRVTTLRSICDPHQELIASLLEKPAYKLQSLDEEFDLEHLIAKEDETESNQDWVIILDPVENLLHTKSPQVIKRFFEDIFMLSLYYQEKIHQNLYFIFSIRSDFLDELKQWEDVLPLLPDASLYHLNHLIASEIQLFFEIFEKSTNIHFENNLTSYLVDSLEILKSRTVDIQLLACFIFNQVINDPQVNLTQTPVHIDQAKFLNMGNVPSIIRQFLNDEVESILATIKNSPRYLEYLASLPVPTPPTFRLDATLRRTIRLVMMCFLAKKNMLVPTSYRAILYQVLKDESAISKRLINLTILALTNEGLIVRTPENPDLLEIPNTSLASFIQTWIDSSIDILFIMDALGQNRLTFSECVAFQRLMTENELNQVSLYADRIGFGSSELVLIFQSSLAHAHFTPQWFKRLKDEFINVSSIIDREKSKTDYKDRIKVILGLFHIGQEMIPSLYSFLEDEYPQVRAYTVAALETLNDTGDWRSKLKFEAYIPEGTFKMGTNRGNFADEGPQHSLYLGSYYISLSPVTYVDFQKYMEDIEEPFDITPGRERHPITNLTWYQIQEYARWASLRLPNEPEWEKAATWNPNRNTKFLYPWGNFFDETRCNMRAAKLNTTTPVGRFSPMGDSSYGCMDMAGNVWEWTNSVFLPYPYNENDGREEKSNAGSRVIRGGSYDCGATYVTCTVRLAFDPYSRRADLGFRTILDIPRLKA